MASNLVTKPPSGRGLSEVLGGPGGSQRRIQTRTDQPAWPLARSAQMLETSLPGVFAVGDVRSGNVKRVASAVGEGAIAIHLVHRALAEL